MTVQTFSIPIDGVPEGWDVIAYRLPVNGSNEPLLTHRGEIRYADKQYVVCGPRLILRKKYTPPAWLKEAGFRWVWRINQGWYASLHKPQFNRGWQNPGVIETALNNLNFTPPELGPDVQDKDTLIEL